jgi:hypothetical protein
VSSAAAALSGLLIGGWLCAHAGSASENALTLAQSAMEIALISKIPPY